MEWTEAHGILLSREMLVVNPFQAKRKTTKRSKKWETVSQNLERIDTPKFKVNVQSVGDRYSLISRKFRRRIE